MKKMARKAIGRIPTDPKEKSALIESFDRAMIKESSYKRFGEMQAKVQSPHQGIDYSEHIKRYVKPDKSLEILYGFELEIEKAPKYTALKKCWIFIY